MGSSLETWLLDDRFYTWTLIIWSVLWHRETLLRLTVGPWVHMSSPPVQGSTSVRRSRQWWALGVGVDTNGLPATRRMWWCPSWGPLSPARGSSSCMAARWCYSPALSHLWPPHASARWAGAWSCSSRSNARKDEKKRGRKRGFPQCKVLRRGVEILWHGRTTAMALIKAG
jgi:hypothetical protein